MTIELGDFVRNIIHDYYALVCTENSSMAIFRENLLLAFVILNNDKEKQSFSFEGTLRLEVNSELEKMKPTQNLIDKARFHLDNIYNKQIVDNLLYIELLNRLNEHEKELVNENKL